MSFVMNPLPGEGELAVDLLCLLVAQVEELRLLAAPALASEVERSALATRVAARARRLRREHPEGAPALLPAAPEPRPVVVPPAPSPVALPASVVPTKPGLTYGAVRRLNPLERTLLASRLRWIAARAESDRRMAMVRGGAA